MQKIQDKRISIRVSNDLLKNIDTFKGDCRSEKVKRILKAGIDNKSIDTCDYSDLINALFELKIAISPVGGNLNQLALYLNRGNNFDSIENISVLDELQKHFKEWIKIMKYLERDLKRR